MSPQIGRAAFALAIFVDASGALLLPFLDPNSAEFVVTVLAIVAGGLTLVLIAIMARLGRH